MCINEPKTVIPPREGCLSSLPVSMSDKQAQPFFAITFVRFLLHTCQGLCWDACCSPRYHLHKNKFWFILFIFFCLCEIHFTQLWQAGSERASEFQSFGSSFSSILKSAYERGVVSLLEEGVKVKLSDAISQLQPQQLFLASKHVLLYLRTTVENYSSVRNFVFLSVTFSKQHLC